jgi:hypothetical protein
MYFDWCSFQIYDSDPDGLRKDNQAEASPSPKVPPVTRAVALSSYIEIPLFFFDRNKAFYLLSKCSGIGCFLGIHEQQ